MHPPTSTPVLQIAVIGAGPSGLSAALRLSAIPSVSVTVYERDPTLRTAGGAINLAPNAMRLIDRLGLAKEAYTAGLACPTFQLLSESGAPLGFIPNCSRDGHPGIRIMRSSLQEVLFKAIESKPNVRVKLGKKVVDVHESVDEEEKADDESVIEGKGNVSIAFSDGSVAHADLLVGADGISSNVRAYVAGDQNVQAEYTGRTVAYGVVHDATKVAPAGKLWAMHPTSAVLSSSGLFAYAFAEPSRSRIFWFTHDDSYEKAPRGHVSKLETEETKERYAERFGNCFEPMPSLVKHSDELYSWPIHALPKLDTWSRGSVILIGDAAHAVSPHRGQGVAMAFEDVFFMARIVEMAIRKREAGGGDGKWEFEWDRYEKVRMPRVNRLREELKNTRTYTARKSGVASYAREWIAWALLRLTPLWVVKYMSMELHEYDPDKVEM